MFITLYRSMIGATLAIKIFKPPVSSLEDVLDSDHILLVSNGTSVHSMFKDAPVDSVLSKIVRAGKLTATERDPISAQEIIKGR